MDSAEAERMLDDAVATLIRIDVLLRQAVGGEDDGARFNARYEVQATIARLRELKPVIGKLVG